MATETVKVPCPVCANIEDAEEHFIEGSVSHDPGCWRTANGDGWPESWDVDFDTRPCPNRDAWTEKDVDALEKELLEAWGNRAVSDDYDGPDTVRERDDAY